MGRALRARERDVVQAMITNAPAFTGPSPTVHDRRQWLTQVANTRAGARCECGDCPSVELEDASEGIPSALDDSRVVLSAGAPGALLLLFIDDNRLSYLELAPLDSGTRFEEFPPVDTIDFSDAAH